MNTQEVVNLPKLNSNEIAEQYALIGIKAMGACISLSSNEHPITRINGLVLAVAPSGTARKVSFLISVSGWLLAKNKKKAFLQRTLSIGITVIGSGIVIQSGKLEA